MAMSAREYLELTELWENTSKDIVAKNIDLLFGYYDEDRISSPYLPTNRRTKILCEITNTCKYTVLGWMNRHREDVRIPLHKLCIIAEAFDVDIANLMNPDDAWYKNDAELRKHLDARAEELKLKIL